MPALLDMDKRRSGLLLHLSSLPGNFGIGDLGPSAYEFADFLAEAGQTLWALLPTNPVGQHETFAPYGPYSAFAGNPLFVSPEALHRDGLLSEKDILEYPALDRRYTDFLGVAAAKWRLLRRAFTSFGGQIKGEYRDAYDRFLAESEWLNDYVSCTLARALRCPGADDVNVPIDVSPRDDELLRFAQFLFFRQWQELRSYANSRGVLMVGDTAFNMAINGTDILTRPELFEVDVDTGELRYEAGAPPDEFVPEGQFWHTAAYHWPAHFQEGFDWWKRRMSLNGRLYDAFRLDHFRGFEASWVIPKGAEKPTDGWFVPGPGRSFFEAVKKSYPGSQMFVEDLGTITDEVHRLRDSLGLAGMFVLQLGFGTEKDHPHLPHKCVQNSVVYTETHDLEPICGWFKDLSENLQGRLCDYVGRKVSVADVHWELIRLALASVSDWALISAQDVLGLGEEGYMNVSGRVAPLNWRWRLNSVEGLRAHSDRLRHVAATYGRTPID
jgi:4-alpha-glucanotransferase